ncbi:UNVERIFIED_CONTAM: hypothetical protein RMT77_002771 [Armadillidium vulgare]
MEEASTTDREEVELTYAAYLDNVTRKRKFYPELCSKFLKDLIKTEKNTIEKMKIVLPARVQLDPVQQAEIIDENFPLEYQSSLDHLISETQSCSNNMANILNVSELLQNRKFL